jgi:hypothetical protein
VASIELPHWIMIGGAFLVIAGFIGLALTRNKEVEADPVLLLPGNLASWKAQQSPLSPDLNSEQKEKV